jgi:prepilin-type N-terminal cleavage/methylation domain-containing protein
MKLLLPNFRVTRRHGFTLLELSVVVAIVALIIGISLSSGIAMLASARQSTTLNKLTIIQQALMSFRTVNNRLPCPASLSIVTNPPSLNSSYYGLEAPDLGSCTGAIWGGAANVQPQNFRAAKNGGVNTGTAAEGAVPAVTLGLPNDFMYDGWGNRFRYVVDVSLTVSGAFPATPIAPACGPIIVHDGNGNARSNGAIYALISHGPNGHGAYTQNGAIVNAGSNSVDELTNCHCTNTGIANGAYAPVYVQKLPVYDATHMDNPAYYFDDIVVFQERWQMAQPADLGTFMFVQTGGNSEINLFSVTGTFLTQFGAAGSGNGQIGALIMGPAIDAQGYLWVADYGSGVVQKLCSNGNYIGKFTGGGKIKDPISITTDASGNLWVADNGNAQIEVFDSNGNPVNRFQGGTVNYFGSSGTGNGQFNCLRDVALDLNGNAWTLDGCSGGTFRVQQFDATTDATAGTYQGQFSSFSLGNALTPSQFNGAQGVSADIHGNVWVADTGNNRVLEFDSNGNWLMTIGGGGVCVSGTCSCNYSSCVITGAPSTANSCSASSSSSVSACPPWTATNTTSYFKSPQKIAFDANGNVWVTDLGSGEIQEYSNTGNFIGQATNYPFSPYTPAGITFATFR